MTETWQRGSLAKGAVATANPLAARAAGQVLEAGGNAADAAVAAAFAMGVVEPLDNGLGGSGFALVHDAASGKTTAVDFLGTAPATARYDLIPEFAGFMTGYRIRVRDEANEVGHGSVAVPGAVRGLALILERFGTMPFRDIVEPAAILAAEGFVVDDYLARRVADTTGYLERYPASAAIFLGGAAAPGATLVQPDLARTLRRLQEAGPDDLYTGDLARRIVKEIAGGGGFLTADDLVGFRPVVRPPVRGKYRDLDVAVMPPSSTGAYVLAGLKALAAQPREDSYLALARAMRQMFELRAASLGDPRFVDVDLGPLGIADLDWRRGELPETTSLATFDRHGNAVCLTYSNMNHSGVVVPGTGIILNNQMLLFAPWPGGANAIAPGKRPVSSMMPTLMFRDGVVQMAIGASGATRIPTAIMQTLHRLLADRMALEDAVRTPRIHAEADLVCADEEIADIAGNVADELGCRLELLPGRDWLMGVVQAIVREEDGGIVAIGEPRVGGQGLVL